MIINNIEGDPLITLLGSGKYSGLILDCNVQCSPDNSITEAAYKKCHAAKCADEDTLRGDIRKLGEYTNATYRYFTEDVGMVTGVFINAYTHISANTLSEYEAFEKIFRRIDLLYPHAHFLMPQLGCLGSDPLEWDIVESIINNATPSVELTVIREVYFPEDERIELK